MRTECVALACVDERRCRASEAAVTAAGFELAGSVYDADGALSLIRGQQPTLLIADAVLPGLDGVALTRRIARMALNRYPYVLLIRPCAIDLPDAASLTPLGGAVIDAPFDGAALSEAIQALTRRGPCLPPEKEARLQALLDALGVPEHAGREALSNAVALVWRDRSRLRRLRDEVYACASAGRTAAQSERAMRHVIETAWRTGSMDEQQHVFGDTIDARRGRPTCGEMIARLADILRWEG